jgi:hypothetical protein
MTKDDETGALEHSVEETENFIQARSLTAVAIAVLVGALAAKFLF